jgi:AmiR/NasT family two-component response regulator
VPEPEDQRQEHEDACSLERPRIRLMMNRRRWQSAIDALRRFSEYQDLEGAFGRRAITERAKGILMERHSIDEAAGFAMLRGHARNASRKLVDVASVVVDSHTLLPEQSTMPHPPS